MKWLKLLGGNILNPVRDILDEIITNKEELAEAKIKIAQVENELTKAYLEDKESARKMSASVQASEHASWLSKNIAPILALLALAIGVYVFDAIFYGDIPKERLPVFTTIIGLIAGWVGAVFTFYFGSSRSSEEKSRQLEKFIKKQEDEINR